MSSIIDDTLSNLQDLDSEHILDLSEVGEEEIATLSEAIQEVIVGVSSVNGMTGDVTLTAGDLNAYTKDQVNNLFATKQDITVTIDGVTYTTSQQFANFVYESVGQAFSQVWEELDKAEKKSNRVTSISENTADNYHYPTTKAVYDLFDSIPEDIIINVTYDAQTQTLHWNGADSIADIKNAFEAGASVTVFAPVLSDEVYRVGWLRSIGPEQLDLMSIDDSWAMDKLSLLENNKVVSLTTVDLQKRLTAGNNIDISSDATISARVPTQTSQLTNNGSGGTSTYVEADQLATVATSGSYNDLLNTPNSYLIRSAISANTNLSGLQPGIYPVNNIAHADFPVAGAMYGTLIQYPDTYKTQVLIAGEAAGSGNENNMYYRRWLTSSNSFTPWTSAQGSSITVDSALNASSTNPVQNQALYPAIVPTEIYKTVYTYEWTGPSGTNLYNCVAILTMPSGTFTNNSLVELVNEDSFNIFAKHGFVLYGSEVSTQRLWITSIGKPTGTVGLKFRIYKWGD